MKLRLLPCLAWLLAALAPRAAAQVTWFAPLDPTPRAYQSYTGSPQYMDLFRVDAPWSKAASHVQVFKIYGDLLARGSDSDLQILFADLQRRHIALALEFGPLVGSGCGQGVEGFSGGAAVQFARRIRANGGVLRYVAMDEPFYYGSLYDGANACHWTAEQIAAAAGASLKVLQNEFGGLIIGDIEPVPPAGRPDWLDRYRDWMDTWYAVAGAPLAFFHADVQWNTPAWKDAVAGLRQAAADRGLAFGMIYNGTGAEQSDAEWVAAAGAHMVDYEVRGGATPDHVIFQSWHPYPQKLLPESDADSFTWLIDRYFRARTELAIGGGSGQVSGTLAGADGNALAGATVTLAGVPVDGPGVDGQYTITGTVPDAAAIAVAGLRVNIECQCAGASEVLLHGFQYDEGTGPASLDFQAGMDGWYIWGDAAASVESGGLHVTASADQTVILNSRTFPVTPGAPFTLRISARVAPRSTGSGYFTIVFLGSQEVNRLLLPFQPATLDLGAVSTANDGSFVFTVPALPPGSFLLRADYAGDDVYWPAEAVIAAQ